MSKLTGTTWGASPSTLRSTALALCYSCAEYACPVWERSAHADKINPALNATCRLVSGCLRPTSTDDLYILAGIAPPEIRRHAASSKERMRQVSDDRHPLFGHIQAASRLKSRQSFLNSVQPDGSIHLRETLWRDKLERQPTSMSNSVKAKEELPNGADSSWSEWRCLNRLRSGVGRCKVSLEKWGYTDAENTTCQCGFKLQTMEHLLRCPLLEKECSRQDLFQYNDSAKVCVQHWLKFGI